MAGVVLATAGCVREMDADASGVLSEAVQITLGICPTGRAWENGVKGIHEWPVFA